MEGSQSCGAAELQKDRVGGGGGVGGCGVAEWLGCKVADCRIAELQSHRGGEVAELGS